MEMMSKFANLVLSGNYSAAYLLEDTNDTVANLTGEVESYFKSLDEAPGLDQASAYADSLGASKEEFDLAVYMLLMSLVNRPQVGKHNDMNDNQFDASQLQVGILVEYEHTNDRDTAEGIAKDHLAQDKQYYTKLVKYGLTDENIPKELLSSIGVTK